MRLSTNWHKHTLPVTRPRCPAGCLRPKLVRVLDTTPQRLKHGLNGTYCPTCGRYFEAQTTKDGTRIRFLEVVSE